MEDLKEVYVNFLSDIGNLTSKTKTKDEDIFSAIFAISEFTNSPEFKSLEINKASVSNFVTRTNDIFSKMYEKKKLKMTDLNSFPIFVNVMHGGGKQQKLFDMNLFNAPNFESLNIFKALSYVIGNRNTDQKTIKEFHNYVLLIYMHSCIVLSSDTEDNEIPKECVDNFNEAMAFFDSNNYSGSTLGENALRIVRDVIPLISAKIGFDESKFLDFLSKTELPDTINELLACFIENTNTVKMNEELKKLSRDDIVSSIEEMSINFERMQGMIDPSIIKMATSFIASNDINSIDPNMMMSELLKKIM